MFKWSAWKPWEVVAFGTLAVAGLSVALMIFAAPEGEEDWEEFKVKNHCVSLAQERGGRAAGWRCDDGEVHYRWRQQK
jgi:hypothetical protein